MAHFHAPRAVTATGGASEVAAHRKTTTELIYYTAKFFSLTNVHKPPMDSSHSKFEFYLMLLQVLLLQLSAL